MPGKEISGLSSFFFSFSFFLPFSALLLTAFPCLSLDSWRGSRWLLFLWLHTEFSRGRVANGFPSSQVQRWRGAVCVLGAEDVLSTEMAGAMTTWEFRFSAFFHYPPQNLLSLFPCSTSFQEPMHSDGHCHTKPRMPPHSSLSAGFIWCPL